MTTPPGQSDSRLNRNQLAALLTLKAKSSGWVHYATAHALERRGLAHVEFDPDGGPGVRYCSLTSAGYTAALRAQGFGR